MRTGVIRRSSYIIHTTPYLIGYRHDGNRGRWGLSLIGDKRTAGPINREYP